MDVELIGVIGHSTLGPKMTWDYRQRDGATKRVPFIRFSMFVEDKTKAPILHKESGKMRRPREIWQVILPENERGQKLFEHLAPGRQVLVKGRMTVQPGAGINRDNEKQLYANCKCRMGEIAFLDSPARRLFERQLNMLQNDLKVINTEQNKTYMEAYEKWDEEQIKLNGPPREVIDNTLQDSPDEAKKGSDDPDSPDFQS